MPEIADSQNEYNGLAQQLQNFHKRLEREGFVIGVGSGLSLQEQLALLQDALFVELTELRRESVTERKRTERLLRESEERFRAIFEHADIGITLVDANGCFLLNNPAFERMLGYSSAELSKLTFDELTHPDDYKGELPVIQEVLAGKRHSYEMDKRYIRKDGSLIWVHLAFKVLKMPDDQRLYAIAVVEDITARKEAEKTLRRYELIAGHSRDVLLFMSLDEGRILEVNTAAIKAYGYSYEEFQNLTVFDLRRGDSREHVVAQMNEANIRGILFETVHTRKDGSAFPVEVSSRGATIGGARTLISVVRDITERRKAEKYQKDLFDKANKQAMLLSGINRVFKEALRTGTDEELGDLCLEIAEAVTGSKFGFIGEIGQNGSFKNLAISGGQKDLVHNGISPGRDPAVLDLCERVAAEGKGLYLNTPSGQSYPTCLLGVPLMRHSDVSGLIVVGGRDGGYRDEDVETLDALASAIVEAFSRRRAEEALRESEEFNRSIVESSQDCIAVLDLNGNLLSLSTGVQQNIEVKDITPYLNSSWIDLWLESDRNCVAKAVSKARNGGIGKFQASCMSAAGRLQWWDVVVTPIRNVSGHPERLLAVSRNITERKQAEQEREHLLAEVQRQTIELMVRKSERQFRALFDHNLDGVFMTLIDGTVTDANAVACRMLGMTKDEICQAGRAGLLVQGDDLAAFLRERMVNGSAKGEVKMIRKDGTRFPVEINSAIISDRNGADFSFSIVRDITERKKAEKALQESYQKLRNLANRLAEVEEKERRRISRELHDQVGQNLTALGMTLTSIRDSFPVELPQPVLKRFGEAMRLLEETTDRIRSVMLELRPSMLDDYGILSALKWYCERFSERTGLVVEVNAKGRLRRMSTEVETALYRIAQEALTNVAKHAQASTVFITLQAEKTIKLTISDDGIGFNDKNMTYKENKGFGLMIMRERALAVGGEVCIRSRPRKGTKVTVIVGR